MGGKQTGGRKPLCFCLAGLIFLLLPGCATHEKAKPGMELQEEAGTYLLRAKELLSRKDFDGALAENQEALSLASGQLLEVEALFYIGLIYAHFENPDRNVMKSLYFLNRVADQYPRNPWAGQAKAWIGILQENERLNQRIEHLNRQIRQFQQEKADIKMKEKKEAHDPLLESHELTLQGKYEDALRETRKILSVSPKHPREDQALFQMGWIYGHPGNPKKDYGKSTAFLRKVIKEYPKSPWSDLAKVWIGMHQENDRLNQTVEKLNQTIDKLNQTIEKSKQVDIEIEEKKREKGK